LDEYGSNDAPPAFLLSSISVGLAQPAAVEGHAFHGLDFSRSVAWPHVTLREAGRGTSLDVR